MLRRACTVLPWVAALLLVAAGPAAASEGLPDGVPIPPASAGKLRDYVARSTSALGKLDALVDQTQEGEEHMDAQWQGVCNDVLRLLADLQKQSHVPDPLASWHASELEAWRRIHRIGTDTMDLHYKMASTLEEVEDDVAVSEAFIRDWRSRLQRLNDLSGQAEKAMEKMNEVGVDNFAGLKEHLGLLNDKLLPEIQHHAQTVSRLMALTRKKKLRFIEQRDLAGPYRDQLAKLKSADMDPDQTGVFFQHEQRWEEVMFKTHARYVTAVERWRKANAWIEKGQGTEAIKRYATKLLELGSTSLLGLPGAPPVLSYDFDEKLGDWCLKVRERVVKVADHAKGQTWAKIESQILSAEEERRMADVEYKQALQRLEDEARSKLEAVQTKNEKDIDAIEKEREKLYRRAAGDAAIDLESEDERLDEQRRAREREIEKWRRFYYNDWLAKEEDKVWEARQEAHEAIDKRLADLGEERSRAR